MFADKVKKVREEYKHQVNETIIKPVREVINLYLSKNESSYVRSIALYNKATIYRKYIQPKITYKNGFMEMSFDALGEGFENRVYAVPCPNVDEIYMKSSVLIACENELFNVAVEFFMGMCVEKYSSPDKGLMIVVKDISVDISDILLTVSKD